MTRADYFYPSLLGVFALIATLAAVDLFTDVKEGIQLAHVLVESAVITVSLGAVLVVLRYLIQQLGAATRLETSDRETQRWRRQAQELLQGLGAAIDRQFNAWRLTAAEKEVALFLLKGLSHKEIAMMRQITVATARQQARSVYKKAGLAGRRDLAAFFLEDLALPLE